MMPSWKRRTRFHHHTSIGPKKEAMGKMGSWLCWTFGPPFHHCSCGGSIVCQFIALPLMITNRKYAFLPCAALDFITIVMMELWHLFLWHMLFFQKLTSSPCTEETASSRGCLKTRLPSHLLISSACYRMMLTEMHRFLKQRDRLRYDLISSATLTTKKT